MGELPLAARHRVLVGSERLQAVGDELVEAVQGLRACDGPGAVRRSPRQVGQLFEDVVVDLVEHEAREVRPRPAVLRRRFAVVGIEVPAAAGRLVALHQDVEPPTLPPVEVLELEVVTLVSPRCELVVVAEELIARHHLDLQPVEQRPTVPAHGLHHDHLLGLELLAVGPKSGCETRGSAVVDLESLLLELCGEVAHG